MKILLTGCAGFIGFHTTKKLLTNKKNFIIGIDNLNNYYDVNLKKDRLKILKNNQNFEFNKVDLTNKKKISKLFQKYKFQYIVHLAAQAGVRYSIKYPEQYVNSNLIGFFNILDCARQNKIKHFIFASTSSVYGYQKKFPNKEEFETDKPLSFYAATKKSNEVVAYSYSNIFNLPITGLRFFTVYGEWGRPDMALFKFTKGIIENKKIDLFGYGKHSRDFTHVEDISNYLSAILKKPSKKKIPYQVFNLCSSKPKNLIYFLTTIEKNLGKKAIYTHKKIQPGDILNTHGDNKKIKKLTKISITVKFEDGIKRFIDWYKKYYRVK